MRQDKTDKFVMMSSEMYIVCVFVVVVVDDCFERPHTSLYKECLSVCICSATIYDNA